MMSPLLLSLLALCVLIETIEQVLYRLAGRNSRHFLLYAAPATMLNLVGLAVWLLVLTRAPLAQALPLLAASNITVAAAGRLLFGETVTTRRWIGIVLISAGLVLVAGYEP
ncbi:MAG: EamA family transporter [Tepidisphaeraceae bacterium]|jgi:drug/metabolite transporter (DMT)-like permease